MREYGKAIKKSQSYLFRKKCLIWFVGSIFDLCQLIQQIYIPSEFHPQVSSLAPDRLQIISDFHMNDILASHSMIDIE